MKTFIFLVILSLAITAQAAEEKLAPTNKFNRLLLLDPPNPPNAAPTHDNIHDPDNEATLYLQKPLEAFEKFPKSDFGNFVDWVQALNNKHIAPRYDKKDPSIEPLVMPMDIVREVTGSMPDVIFPHLQHTQWLACENCHPKIFIPQRNFNKITMDSIINGKHCGVCHGHVSFPVNNQTCYKCHSKAKPSNWTPPKSEAKATVPWMNERLRLKKSKKETKVD